MSSAPISPGCAARAMNYMAQAWSAVGSKMQGVIQSTKVQQIWNSTCGLLSKAAADVARCWPERLKVHSMGGGALVAGGLAAVVAAICTLVKKVRDRD